MCARLADGTDGSHPWNKPSASTLSFRSRWLSTPEELEQIRPAWTKLVHSAVRGNPFFDPGFLIPAFKYLNDQNARVFIVECLASERGEPVICALLPLVQTRIYGLPFSCLEIWKHDQCFDCTPLIREDCAQDTIEFLFESLAKDHHVSLLSAKIVDGNGPIAQLFQNTAHQNSLSMFIRQEFSRESFVGDQTRQDYVDKNVSAKTQRKMRTAKRKLAKLGDLTIQESDLAEASESWIQEFLDLESSGWKGKEGTALGSQSPTRSFFKEMAQNMLSSGELGMLKIELDGKPIAMLCNLHHSDYSSAFKTTYDETLKRFSPGLLAEFENLNRLHRLGVESMDSCSNKPHTMLSRLWNGRLSFNNFVVALKPGIVSHAVSAMPLIRWAANRSIFQQKT